MRPASRLHVEPDVSVSLRVSSNASGQMIPRDEAQQKFSSPFLPLFCLFLSLWLTLQIPPLSRSKCSLSTQDTGPGNRWLLWVTTTQPETGLLCWMKLWFFREGRWWLLFQILGSHGNLGGKFYIPQDWNSCELEDFQGTPLLCFVLFYFYY